MFPTLSYCTSRLFAFAMLPLVSLKPNQVMATNDNDPATNDNDPLVRLPKVWP